MHHTLSSRFKLTPLSALTIFSAIIALPMLYATSLRPAVPTRYSTVTVRANDTLWTLAAAHGAPGTAIQTTLDEIITANHLNGVAITPGSRLRIPR